MIQLERILEQSLEQELLILVDELKAKHIELGQKASGKWTESLRVVVQGSKGILYGEDYTEQLAKGRPPGARPPIAPLEQWAKVKLGLQGKEALNAAFAIAVKISREGTEIHKEGGTDLIDGVITQQRIDKMYSKVGEAISFEIEKEFLRF